MPKMSKLNSMSEYAWCGVSEMSIGDLKLMAEPKFWVWQILPAWSELCISVSVSLYPDVYVTLHILTRSRHDSDRGSVYCVVCSIYFLGSRDAAYINTEQSFKELGIWKAILYRVNSRGEQVTQHLELIPIFGLWLSELYFYLERGGMWHSEPGLVLVVTWLTVSHVAISDQWPSEPSDSYSDTRGQCRTLSSVVSTHCMDSLRSLNTGGCQIWLEADNGLLGLSLSGLTGSE